MRIITGDECGLLKEIIPELCRPLDISNARSVHAGRARPSANAIQAAAASYGNYTSDAASTDDKSSVAAVAGGQRAAAVQRLETNADAQSRERGIVSLTFLQTDPDNNDGAEEAGSSSAAFQFAALRMNGVVETWSGNRIPSEEVNVTAAMYKKSGGLVKSVLSSGNEDDEDAMASSNISGDENDNNDGSSAINSDAGANTGWHTQQPIRPIGMVSTFQNKNPILATCDSIGNISLINANQMSRGIVSTYNAFDIDTSISLPTPSSSKNAIGKGTLTYTKGRFANTSIATSLALCGGGDRLAVGGRERGMRVVDLESGKLLWKAKNLPPDPQTLLQQPMWTTSIQFLHTPTTATSYNNKNNAPTELVATGTAHKQVQIYDIRVSATSAGVRRPVLYTPEHLLTHRITSLCQLPNGNTLAVGDSIGDVHLLDMRKMHSGKQFTSANFKQSKDEIGLGRLVGPGGSIRQLGMHPTLPYLACVGLDRKLWTWDVEKRKMMDCVYLRQRLNCLLFCEDETWNAGGGLDDDDGDDNDGMELDGKRELEEDEVEDYVDSDDDDNVKNENGSGAVLKNNGGSDKQKVGSGGTSSAETASDSEEGSCDDDSEEDDDAESESEDGESISEKEAAAAAATNPKKRRKK